MRRLSYGLIALTLVLLAAALSAVAYSSLQRFERVLQPQLEAKAVVVAGVIGSEINRALKAGIPLDRLEGFTPFADAALAAHPEILRVELRDKEGHPLFASSGPAAADALWNSDVHVSHQGRRLGRLAVAVAPNYVSDRLRDIQAEVVAILLVALFLTFEVLLVVVAMFVTEPVQRLSQLLSVGAKGYFRKTVGRESNDEIGRFAKAFNKLIRREQERYTRLAEIWRDLGP